MNFADEIEDDITFVAQYLSHLRRVHFLRNKNIGRGWHRLQTKEWNIDWNEDGESGIIAISKVSGSTRVDPGCDSMEILFKNHIWRRYGRTK